ncbi:LmbE family protein [Streptomyces agglomeratus]|nr:LmbE family protein [Streptomyces agglomeratus]OEJ45199.1 LmbE family protein [Streptomyces agglomeratus]OEJ60310.1 LmbE family protein [Streptomyces agglomeratus]
MASTNEGGRAPARPGEGGPRSGPDRRALITSAAAAAAGLAVSSCSVPAPRRTGPAPDPLPGKPISRPRRALLLQILAHPDDDLYFMNPDTQQTLDSGVPLVCVYVTAGEANGVNRVPGAGPQPADRTAYSSARHQGLRQAYAVLLGLPRFTGWQRSVTTLRGDRKAELNTLVNGDRRVELVFLNLAMHTTRGRTGLPSLWEARGLSLRTVVADGSPLEKPGSYDHDGLVDVLAGLMERYLPTVVQTLDPDPDIQHSDEATRRRDSEQPGYSDHADHTAAASFAWAAMIRRVAEATEGGGEVPGFVATSYRGYYNRHWPKNLPEPVLRKKASHLVPYGGSPDWECGNAAGCGDYNVGGDRPLTNRKGWVRSTHYRYPGARPIVATGPGGRLTAYGVLGLRVARWRETAPGSGVWGAPDDLGGGPLAPALGAAALPDGRQLLFGLRFSSLAGHGAANTREIVLLEERAPGGESGAWTGLGNPEKRHERGRRIGSPVAVAAPDGRVHLFVRNADKGISTRVRGTAGRWDAWRDLGGGEIQDGLATAVDGHGRVHVFAAGHETVHHWTQDAPGRPVTARPGTGLPTPGGSPTALTAADGGIDLIYRRPATAHLTTARIGGARPARLRFHGYGAVGAATAPAGPVLLGRDRDGRVQLLAEGRLLRRDGLPPSLEGATLHLGPGDRGPVVVGMGADAAPWLWRP